MLPNLGDQCETRMSPLKNQVGVIRSLHLQKHLGLFDLAAAVKGEQLEVDPVVVPHPLYHVPAQQRVPFDVVDGQVGNDVLASAALAQDAVHAAPLVGSRLSVVQTRLAQSTSGQR